ncbi:MAG TPA: DUF885 family protein [Pyrinomonadaceae bacterium]|jgi:hypothetical protein
MNILVRLIVSGCLLLALAPVATRADALDNLARDFWAWRARYQPLSGDDIPRIERSQDWVPAWSKASIFEQRRTLADFEKRLAKMDASQWPVSRQVDYRLTGSAIARAHWELEIVRNFERNPMFYVDQTMGAIFERLLQPPPFSPVRSQEIITRLKSIPQTVEAAKINLEGSAIKPFALLAIEELKDVRPRLFTVAREIKPLIAKDSAAQLDQATEQAIIALESLRVWLEQHLPAMSTNTAIGRDNYIFFLRKVALVPFTSEQLLAMGRQEWERAVAFETYELRRNEGMPPLTIFPNQMAQIARGVSDELAIRKFLDARGLLTVPAWVQHYRNLPLPAYLEPLSSLGVMDDLTSPTRLKEDGISYIPQPKPALGYFNLSRARDPRPIIVHEGVPGHYLQLVLSWAHEDPIRRHYYDSGANEGIGFYAEEMMLQSGLFDDSPRTREIIYNFMRLRALRVEVDVKLALGIFTIQQAADYLEKTVPMDKETARSEAAFFAAAPGQAISYQIGKLQIVKFLADTRRTQGERFSLRAFHDFVWKNGNVPFSLQRWELLGLRDEIDEIDKYRPGQ